MKELGNSWWFTAVRSGGITFSLIYTDQRLHCAVNTRSNSQGKKLTCDISITWHHLHISIIWPHWQWAHEEEVGSILLLLKCWNGIVWWICHDDEALIEGRADLNCTEADRKPCYSFHTWRGVYINDLKQKNTRQAKNSREKPNYDLREKGILRKILLICKKNNIWWCWAQKYLWQVSITHPK